MFAPQIDALSDLYRIIAIDARGHGSTTDDGSPFTYWDLARDTLSVLDHLGITHAIVGGMSQGGYTALRTALLAPQRIDALLLLDTEAAACTDEEKTGYRELFSHWCSDAPLEPLTANLAPQLIGSSSDHWEPWLQKWYVSDRYAIANAAECLIERDDIAARLPEIDAPTLILRGENDNSAPAEKAEQLHRGLPNAHQVVTIAEAGHSANWTHPEPVNRAIREFLDELPTPR